ncbi:hypothetical protein QBC39DRAFT_53258 [Podospora conica]|nr:hypothetical protein QBC39DRAFT_53258 [Schizothecium conicum]
MHEFVPSNEPVPGVASRDDHEPLPISIVAPISHVATATTATPTATTTTKGHGIPLALWTGLVCWRENSAADVLRGLFDCPPISRPGMTWGSRQLPAPPSPETTPRRPQPTPPFPRKTARVDATRACPTSDSHTGTQVTGLTRGRADRAHQPPLPEAPVSLVWSDIIRLAGDQRGVARASVRRSLGAEGCGRVAFPLWAWAWIDERFRRFGEAAWAGLGK